MNDKTIQYYNEHAAAYVSETIDADMEECRARFLRYLNPGQRILDAGCGSGRDALAFKKAGYEVEAFDASEELCRIAKERTGVPVFCCRFEELESENLYDGIWACASLLHVSRTDLPDVLCALHKMLKPGGILYASFKRGDCERVKDDGRYFCDMTEEKCREVMEATGLTVKELFITHDVRTDRADEKWVNVISRK